MVTSANVMLLGYIEVLACFAVVGVLIAKKQFRDYWSLGSFLAVRAVSGIVLAVLLFIMDRRIEFTFLGKYIDVHVAYAAYFDLYWCSYAVESILALITVYTVFSLAMAPLKGLQSLGMLIFRWAVAISMVVALGSAFEPSRSGFHYLQYLVTAISHMQRTQSILTLCLLLFVCFAIRPMGLNYASRIFGVSLGLGIMSTTDLVQSAWLDQNRGMYTGYNLINGMVVCATLIIWTAYFGLPEPKRRVIVLPTTSPFLRWNQISLALGDNPGFVAVGGVPPEIFAPAELEIMRRASAPRAVTPFPKSLRA